MSSDEIDGLPSEGANGDQEAPPSRDGDDGATEERASAPDEDDEDDQAPTLAQTLLHRPVEPAGGRPASRYAYTWWFQLVASLFILYHGTILLVHNLPGKGLAKGLQQKLNQEPKLWPLSEARFGLDADRYWHASGNTQSWAMFAPNPHRSNIFMKVLVKDEKGEVWDLKHDIYGKRSYPYLWYDRMGKINRRIIDQKGYRRHYAAWVCRKWEKDHGGESAEEVQFVKMWTRIPPPQAVFERAQGNIFKMGYDPMELELNQREEETIRCRTNRHAQLPPYLRERYGLPEAPEHHFKELHMRTWWDIKQDREERDQARGRGGDK
ncbi:MAG: hypothetical protein KDK70_02225 [Myxococcales bacterium]|nr:hypothetical protein [Myxococcales bacterium]